MTREVVELVCARITTLMDRLHQLALAEDQRFPAEWTRRDRVERLLSSSQVDDTEAFLTQFFSRSGFERVMMVRGAPVQWTTHNFSEALGHTFSGIKRALFNQQNFIWNTLFFAAISKAKSGLRENLGTASVWLSCVTIRGKPYRLFEVRFQAEVISKLQFEAVNSYLRHRLDAEDMNLNFKTLMDKDNGGLLFLLQAMVPIVSAGGKCGVYFPELRRSFHQSIFCVWSNRQDQRMLHDATDLLTRDERVQLVDAVRQQQSFC